MKILVIGSGQAGVSVLRALRKGNASLELALVTADSGDFYAKPLLSNAFTQQKSPPQLITQPLETLIESLKCTAFPRTRAIAIDRPRQQLVTSLGPFDYDILVLATGASPVQTAVPKDSFSLIHRVNDLASYLQFRHALAAAGATADVVILGSGLVGCEFANDLIEVGHRVAMVSPDDYPLQRLLPPKAGQALRDALVQRGVRFYFGATATQLEWRSWNTQYVTLSQGETLTAHVVLSAQGLSPQSDLAHAAGLTTDPAIVTDAWGRTSDPQIYALGDCARIDGQWLPYIAPILHAAKAMAATICGQPTPIRYPPLPIVIKTPALPLVVAPPTGRGDWHWLESTGGLHGEWRDEQGHLHGFILGGNATTLRQKLIGAMGS